MKLVNNKIQFETLNPYKGLPETYPKRYPCLVEWGLAGGGLMGEYYKCNIVEIPKDVDLNSFLAGFKAAQ